MYWIARKWSCMRSWSDACPGLPDEAGSGSCWPPQPMTDMAATDIPTRARVMRWVLAQDPCSASAGQLVATGADVEQLAEGGCLRVVVVVAELASAGGERGHPPAQRVHSPMARAIGGEGLG